MPQLRLDDEHAVRLEPLAPADKQSESLCAVEVLEDMVEPDLPQRARRTVQHAQVGLDVGVAEAGRGAGGRREVDVEIAGQAAAARVEAGVASRLQDDSAVVPPSGRRAPVPAGDEARRARSVLASLRRGDRLEEPPPPIIVLGIDKFMSECRALTNLCGNGVACVIVAWWEGELDRDKLNANLARQIDPTDMETAVTTD